MDEGTARPPARYRRDIQGLRAVSVVLVVVCHTGAALPGGFVGVDMFFVISGFVIGSLLLRDLETGGSVSIAAFYARRARRILPAITVLIVVGVAVGVLVLNPYRSQVIPFRTAGAASVFIANVYLYRHVGYFDGAADGTNPFLHLWSLSVEEQFYLVLPLLLLVGWRLGGGPSAHRRRMVTAAVAMMSALSFGLSLAMTSGRSPLSLQAPERAAFYGAPTRAWELGLGVLLALGARRTEHLRSHVSGALALAGAVLVAASAFGLDALHPYSGLAVVPAVAGAALLLVGGATSKTAGWVLSGKAMCWVGDRSYSWYLWHWPMIVYARVLWPRSSWVPLLAAALSLVVAAGAYAAFEDRIRRNHSITGRRALLLGAVCIGVSLAVVAVALQGSQRGLGVSEPNDWYEFTPGWNTGCVLVNRDMADDWDRDVCTQLPTGGESPRGTVLVLGDRQADSITTAVLPAADARHLAVASWARAGCPFTSAAPEGYPACEGWQRRAMELVDELDPELVVISNRATAYTTAVDRSVGSNAGRIRAADGAQTRSPGEALRAWSDGLRTTVTQLEDRGIPVVVVGTVPDYAGRFPNPSVLRPGLDAPVRSRAAVAAELAGVGAAEERALVGFDRAAHVDPVSALCRDACTPLVDGRWWYLDAFTINTVGAARLVPAVTAAIDEVLPTGR